MIFTCMIVKLILQTIMLLHDMHTPLENGFWGGTLKLLEKTLLGVRKFWFWRGSIFFQGGGCQRFFEKNKKLCNHSIKNQLIFSFSFTFHALQILLHFQYCTSNIMSSLKMWRLFWKEIPVLAKKGQFQWDINFWTPHTAQKTKFSIKDFFSKCDQIRSFLQIWSDLLKKSLMENFTFCAVSILQETCGNITLWNSTRVFESDSCQDSLKPFHESRFRFALKFDKILVIKWFS